MIPQFLKFAAIGAINTLVGLAVIAAAMYFFDLNPIAANAMGYIVGIAVSFALNGKLTFRQPALSARMFTRFVVVSVIAYVVNLAVVWVWLDRDKYAAQVLGAAVYVLISFFGSRMLVFRS